MLIANEIQQNIVSSNNEHNVVAQVRLKDPESIERTITQINIIENDKNNIDMQQQPNPENIKKIIKIIINKIHIVV
jgi:hypothetical protein